MVRAKKAAPPPNTQAQEELNTEIENLKKKLAADAEELERAKRRFSTRFVDEILKAIEAKVPDHVMKMKVTDFARTFQQNESMDDDHLDGQASEPAAETMKTPTGGGKRKFKSLQTPSGVRVQIPSMITPRVDGGMLNSRQSRRGEVLISLNGTPVLTLDGKQQQPSINSEQTALIQQLLQKDEQELTPETRAIVGNLRVVLTKKMHDGTENSESAVGDEV